MAPGLGLHFEIKAMIWWQNVQEMIVLGRQEEVSKLRVREIYKERN
jgi:hypothetical protein